MVDQLLITTQLDGIVTTDRVVEIGDGGLLEGVVQIDYPEGGILVFEDLLVGYVRFIGLFGPLVDKVLVVQIAFVDR